MVPPPTQNAVGVCYQITLLILYYISPRPVTLIKVNDGPRQVSDILDLSVYFELILALRYSFILFLKCLLAAHLTLCRLSNLLWYGSHNHCILACILRSKNLEHFSLNHWSFCFNSYRPEPSLTEVLIFSLIMCSLTIIEVLQSCKPVWDLNLLLFPNLELTQLPEIKYLHIQFLYCLLPIFP